MGSVNSLILSMKVFVISAGVVSLAVGIKVSVPIALNGIPTLWSLVLSWLKPPYLYIIINCIIFTIAASSRFHRNHSESISEQSTFLPADFEISKVLSEESTATDVKVFEIEEKVVEANDSKVNMGTDREDIVIREDVSADSILAYNTTLQGITSAELQMNYVREKPLVSSRFNHRKPVRSIPEGVKALRVTRPRRQETVESTWKMITEGRHVPLTRHQKKPEPAEILKKPPVQRIRKEPSLGQDELNRRVEAFINKFNEDMKLQRQESLKQYI